MFVWTLFIVCACRAAEAQVEVQARADRTAVTTRDVIQLEVQVSATGAIGDLEVEIAPVEGLTIERLPSVSTSFTIINGRQSSMRTYVYRVTPQRAGTYRLDGIAAVSGGQVWKAAPLTLQVTDAPQLPRDVSPGTTFVPLPPGTDLPAHFLRATIDPATAYIDQPVRITYEVFTTAKREDGLAFDSDQLDPSLLSGRGFTVYPFDHADARRQYRAEPVVLNGVEYLRVRVRSFFLFPVTAGRHRLPRASLTLEMVDRSERRRDFFGGIVYGRKQVQLLSDPLELEVVSLPEAGKPASFGGAVGQYRMTASLDKTDVKVGEPVTLTLTIAGQGRVDNVNTPEFGPLPDFRQFQVTSDKQPPKVDENGVMGAITFSYVLVPKNQNATRLPALEWSYFDPVERRYKTLSTQPMELAVHPGELSDEPELPLGFDGRRISFGYENLDFRAIVADLDRLGSAPALLVYRPWFWLVQLIPAMFMAGTWYWRRERMRRAANPAAWRSRRAARAARRRLKEAEAVRAGGDDGRFYSALANSLIHFVSDRFNLEARGLTQSELCRRLCAQGAPREVSDRLGETLSRWDRLRFAGEAGNGAAREDELAAARRLIDELEKCR
ncbi:protein BatD [bacterium]|nr:protein BatD [bacterium]